MKKTLVISTYAPPAIGGPQNFYNLLRDFPADSYYILTSFYNIDNLSAKSGTWLDGEYIFYDNPGATRKNLKMLRAQEGVAQKRSFLSRLKHLSKRSALIRNVIGPFVILGQIILIVRQGKKTLKEKKVDIMLVISDYGPALIGTYLLHKLTKKPFSLFLFDLYKGNFFPFPGGLLAQVFEPKLFRQADIIVTTNEGTREFYGRRYGKEALGKMVVIHNATFPEPYLKLQKPYEPKPPYTILYTGRIYWPQIRSLKNLLKAVDEITDLDIRVKIYCPNPPEYLKSLGIEGKKVFWGVAPPSEIPDIQSQADILFLPLSWHTKSQEIIDTATPGKLADYLVSGRPILIHAPNSSFLVRYAKQYNFALVVDEENMEFLKQGIRKLLLEPVWAQKLIQNAKAVFMKNHDANKCALAFKKIFLESNLERRK